MRILIVEDEPLAAQRLERLLKELLPQGEIVGKTASVRQTCAWLLSNPQPDLAFLDIQLGDGLSFEIFERCPLSCPVIFTTAYDAYALQAFKLNSIDYLLKPVAPEELTKALAKLQRWQAPQPMAYEMASLHLQKNYKERFLIKLGENLQAVPVQDVLYFVNENRATFLTDTDGRRHLIDYSLNQLEELIDPEQFFRINRQQMLRFEAIEKMVAWSSQRLKLTLKHTDEPALVSRERVQEFKAWLDR